MPDLQRVPPRWPGFCFVAASGPSLTDEVAEACKGVPVVAVGDAYLLMPDAAVLYHCDAGWWDVHSDCRGFTGECWSSHGDALHNDKRAAAKRHGLKLIQGRASDGFSFDPSIIHYGDNSGFQAVNLAIHFLGAKGRIALVGFNMQKVNGKRHFFGDHPSGLCQTERGYALWARRFAKAAETLPPSIEIVNCTPDSALRCFKMMDLRDALPVAA